jgi:uncharacterized protein (DUF952 family)
VSSREKGLLGKSKNWTKSRMSLWQKAPMSDSSGYVHTLTLAKDQVPMSFLLAMSHGVVLVSLSEATLKYRVLYYGLSSINGTNNRGSKEFASSS